MNGDHGREREAATSLNVLHSRLVDLSEEYLHYEIADDHPDFEGFSAYARTSLVEAPGQVARYLYQLADEAGDDRLSELAADIQTYHLSRIEGASLSERAEACLRASEQMSSAPSPSPARLAIGRS